MTNEEAEKVVRAAQWADGGCAYCAQMVVDRLKIELPDIDWQSLNDVAPDKHEQERGE